MRRKPRGAGTAGSCRAARTPGPASPNRDGTDRPLRGRLTACGETPAAFERRCIPAEPRRFAALCVAFRSKYTRYSSLTRLVSRAPPRSRRSPGFHHRLLGRWVPLRPGRPRRQAFQAEVAAEEGCRLPERRLGVDGPADRCGIRPRRSPRRTLHRRSLDSRGTAAHRVPAVRDLAHHLAGHEGVCGSRVRRLEFPRVIIRAP